MLEHCLQWSFFVTALEPFLQVHCEGFAPEPFEQVRYAVVAAAVLVLFAVEVLVQPEPEVV
ncbi:hypothetical protein KDI_03520 [Dictyobacter arantiisoli]|uniref:Uncharacterized protein n=1 Tax=Dictyobacter arantiisoli TaxID=2014874 RepID=A0A5A5T5Z5_9CHLR|nr:hypothetical protein KDI_03520 [Dictyobacter arantiisoli]